uniref:Legume lectin domain-containing protein n=1 Tax=Oryza punctata TaxID=4537 RepID=A0A0E0LQT6_ORYPU
MAGFSLITCAAGLIFFSICYMQPPAPVAALSFNYPTFASSDNQNIEIEGQASVSVEYIDISTNSVSGMGNSAGRVSYKPPMQLWDAATGEVASFTTNFSFDIIPSDTNKKGVGYQRATPVVTTSV